MVKITKVYTRTGDKGTTALGDNTRVPKDNPRVSAYGTTEEANAVLGIARIHAPAKLQAALGRIQNDLFDVGGDLCLPTESSYKHEPLRITAQQVQWLEHEIDTLNAPLETLHSFILPGGTPAAAHLHHARTVVRRAEREISALAQDEKINTEALRYMNRLSDYLFVAARYANSLNGGDVLWIAGANRNG